MKEYTAMILRKLFGKSSKTGTSPKNSDAPTHPNTAKSYSQIHEENPYDATQNASNLSKMYEDAEESLRHQTYAERAKPYLLGVEAIRFSYPIISFVLAVCAVWLMADMVTQDIELTHIKVIQFAGIFVIGFLIALCIELGKSYASTEVFKYKAQAKIMFTIVLTLFSIGFSGIGGYLLSMKLTDKTALLTEQTQHQSDSVKTQYAEQIALLKSQIEKDNEVLKKYKAGDYRVHYASERLAQNTPKLTELMQLQKADLEGLGKEKEAQIQSNFTKNHAYALGFALFILVLEILYILSIREIIQIKRKIKTENRNHNIVPTPQKVQVESPEKVTLESVAVQMLLSQIQNGYMPQFSMIQPQIKPKNTDSKVGFRFNKNTSNDNENAENNTNQRTALDETRKDASRSNDTRKTQDVGDGNRHCKNCGEVFTYRTWNHVYCSDKCRIEAWEKRTGKKLKKGKKGTK